MELDLPPVFWNVETGLAFDALLGGKGGISRGIGTDRGNDPGIVVHAPLPLLLDWRQV